MSNVDDEGRDGDRPLSSQRPPLPLPLPPPLSTEVDVGAEAGAELLQMTDVAVLPLGTLCDAAGIPGELIEELYAEIVHAEPEIVPIGLPEGVAALFSSQQQQQQQQQQEVGPEGGVDGAQEPLQLVAVPEAELDAIEAIVAAAAAAPADEEATPAEAGAGAASLASGERQTLLPTATAHSNGSQAQPPAPFAASAASAVAASMGVPRRRLHVRDVSVDFAAMALEAIPEKRSVVEAAPHPNTVLPLPPSSPSTPRSPTKARRFSPSFQSPPLSGQLPSAAAAAFSSGEDAPTLLDCLMERANSFRGEFHPLAPLLPPPSEVTGRHADSHGEDSSRFFNIGGAGGGGVNEAFRHRLANFAGAKGAGDVSAAAGYDDASFRSIEMSPHSSAIASKDAGEAAFGHAHLHSPLHHRKHRGSEVGSVESSSLHSCQRATFVILDASLPTPVTQPALSSTVTCTMVDAAASPWAVTDASILADNNENFLQHRGRHNRGAGSIIPDALLVPLERGLSILPGGDTTLPSDVQEIKLEIDRHEGKDGREEVDVTLVVKRTVPVVGYVLIVVATFTLSTVGPVLDMQEEVTPTLKAYWRMFATWMALLPMAIRATLRDGGLPKLSAWDWSSFLWMGLGYSSCALLFVLALELTSVMNTNIFCNMHVLMFVLIKLSSGTYVSCREGLGALIGFVGGVICAWDGSRVDGGGGGDDGGDAEAGRRFLEALVIDDGGSGGGDRATYLSYVGDFLALMSAVGTVVYLSIAEKLRPRVDLFLCMFLQFFIGSFWLLGYMIATNENFSLSFDPHHGLWGWVNPRFDRLPLELWLVFVCNLAGIVGYVASMKYFGPIVVACCQNLTPVIASLTAVAVGVEGMPGPITMMGDVVVFGGTYMVISSESESTEVTDVKETARQRGYDVSE